MVSISTYGIATSFGVYQAYYELDYLSTYTSSDISWIGTTQIFLIGLISTIAGPLYDHGYSSLLLCIGCALVVFGLFTLSFATTYWQVLLAQGFCIGIGTNSLIPRSTELTCAGNGLIYVPGIAVVTHTFERNQAAALGVAATGASLGGTIIPIMFRRLVPTVGFGWFNRILGFMMLLLSLIAITLLRSQQASRPSRLFDTSAIKHIPFVFLCVGLFLVELGLWIPPFALTPYAQISLGADADYAFYLLAIMNAGSFAGRILPAYFSQIRGIGPAWVLVAGSLSLGVLVLSWITIRTIVGITIWAILTGFMSGITVSMPNAVLPKLSNPTVLGARSGMMWAFVSIAALIGAPIAGKLINTGFVDYRNGQLFSGISICAGAALLCVPAVHITHKRLA